MSMKMTAHLVETATKVATTINGFGDKVYGSTSSVACLYRDISIENRLQNRLEVNIDGLLWLEAGSTVFKGDVYNHSSEGYLQIEKVTRAKRLVVDNSEQFVKCEVIKIRQIS